MTFSSRLIGFAAASAIALSALSAPAMALGKKEKNILAGLAAAAVIGHLINQSSGQSAGQAAGPSYGQAGPQPPQYYVPPAQPDHGHTYGKNHRPDQRPSVQPPRPPLVQQNSVHNTILASAFKSYSSRDRQSIQRRLKSAGYYAGAVDGAFGPRTYDGLVHYARAAGYEQRLNTSAGAYDFLNRILR